MHLSADDRFAILDVISSYSWAYDVQEWDLHLSLWADDAVLEGLGGDVRVGPDITRGSRERREGMAAKGIQTRHYQTNTMFSPVDADRVRARTIFHVYWQHAGEPAPAAMHSGEYRDEFVRTPSGWKFAHRQIVIDHA